MAEPKDSGDLDLWHSKIKDSERNKIRNYIFDCLYNAEFQYTHYIQCKGGTEYDIPSTVIGFDQVIELSFVCWYPQDIKKYKRIPFKVLATSFKDIVINSNGAQYFETNILPKFKIRIPPREPISKEAKYGAGTMMMEYIETLHDLRNEFQHRLDSDMVNVSVQHDKLRKFYPPYVLEDIRMLAIWIFAIAFRSNYKDIEKELTDRIAEAEQFNDLSRLINQQGLKPASYETNSALNNAFLLGKWDDGNPDDLKIISEFTDE